jgi:hypothetical protein
MNNPDAFLDTVEEKAPKSTSVAEATQQEENSQLPGIPVNENVQE